MEFFVYLFLLGIIVIICGEISVFASLSLINLFSITNGYEFYIRIILTTLVMFIYVKILENQFLKLYKKFNIKFYLSTNKEKWLSRIINTLIFTGFYHVMDYMIIKLENQMILRTMATIIISTIFGFMVKNWFDSIHKIKRVPIE